MESLCAFVLDRASVYPSFCFNEQSEGLDVSEIWSFHPSNELQTTHIPDFDVGSWLTKGTPHETEASTLLRLVWVRLHKDVRPWQLNIRKSSLDAVLGKLKIEEAYRYSFTSPGTFAVMPVHRTRLSNTLVFSLCMPDLFAVVWTHDAVSGRTEGVCWADDWISEVMQDVVSHLKGWAQHPLFLALAVSVMLGHLLDRDLDREVKSIAAVENRTRYHGFKHTSVGIAEGDYALLSERMSGCAVSLAGLERIFKVLDDFLGEISTHMQRHGVKDDPNLENVNQNVNESVETLKRRLKMQNIQIDYLSRRVEIQLRAVGNASFIPQLLAWHPLTSPTNHIPTQLFNLIAQKETKVGIAVAEDSRTLAAASKEDSTAMKTLAAVTVAFLPGTSVAAFFAMPLFEWNAISDGMIVSKRFWIYWAVTVPLTFLTLVIWALWTRRQARVQRISERRAREELLADIEVNRGGGMVGGKEP